MKSGNLNFLEPSGRLQACNGTDLPLLETINKTSLVTFDVFTMVSLPCGPGSSVSTVTGYGLDGPRIESRWVARFSALVQTSPGAHSSSCKMGTGSFSGVKSGWGVTPTPHPLLMPWSWKGRAIPLLPLWTVRLVQSLSACTRVTFTFFTFSLPYSVLQNRK